MARQRRNPGQSKAGSKATRAGGRAARAAGKARPVSSAWAKRNARAQALGYRNYYEYRVRGTKPGSQARARARGHRSSADLAKQTGPGDLVMVDRTERDVHGRLTKVVISVIDGETSEQRTYTLTGRTLTSRNLRRLVDRIDQAGGIFSPSPSLDLRRIGGKDDDIRIAA